MTLKEIVEWVQSIVENHKQVDKFSYGLLSDLKPDADKYPYVFLTPLSHTKRNRDIIYSFDLIIMDIVNNKDMNGPYTSPDADLLVQSRCINILLDILAEIEYGENKNISFIKTGNITPFVDRFDDAVAGVSYNLQLQVRKPLDACVDIFNNQIQIETINNYFDLVSSMRKLSLDHKMINSFYYGFLSDIKFNDIQQISYPYMFLLPTNHTYTTNVITYRFNMLIMDIVKNKTSFDIQDFDNYLIIQSNCLEYGLDILSFIDKNISIKIDFNKTFDITTFVERFDDELSGATFTIEFQVPTKLNLCDAPYKTN